MGGVIFRNNCCTYVGMAEETLIPFELFEKVFGRMSPGIKIEYHNHNHIDTAAILNELNIIKLQNQKIIMTTQEAVEKLNQQAAQVSKIRTEVQTLIDAVNNQGNVAPEVETAINNVGAALQGLDDMNADASPTTQE